ncbi:MAG TPA: cytochrome c [Asticcacaulis sp.]|nr:cytochrome c [Asticcacaulis sp.]
MKHKFLTAAILSAAGIATAALALDAAATIKARHDFFHSLGGAYKTVNDQLKSSTPDLTAVRAATAQIATLAPQLPSQFPAGTGPEAGVKTGAKPEIWTNAADFKTKADGLATAAAALNKAAAGSDVAAITAASKDLGTACKNCHTTYRNQDH